MTAPQRVIVVGDTLLDVLAHPDVPLMVAGDVPGRVALRPGGQGANVAVRLARRGVSVRLVTALAEDPAGRLLRMTLGEEGVELEALAVTASGSVLVMVDAAGERTMLSQRAPFAHLVTGESLGSLPSWIVVSGYLLLEPAARQLVRVLAAVTTPVAILGCAIPGAAHAATWGGLARDARADLLIVNAAEATALLEVGRSASGGVDAGTLAEALAVRMDGPVIVTGPRGAVAAGTEGVRARVSPAPGIGEVIDTTGVGDAFAAAVIASLADGQDLHAALHEGVTLAAAVARVEGAQTRVRSSPDGGPEG